MTLSDDDLITAYNVEVGRGATVVFNSPRVRATYNPARIRLKAEIERRQLDVYRVEGPAGFLSLGTLPGEEFAEKLFLTLSTNHPVPGTLHFDLDQERASWFLLSELGTLPVSVRDEVTSMIKTGTFRFVAEPAEVLADLYESIYNLLYSPDIDTEYDLVTVDESTSIQVQYLVDTAGETRVPVLVYFRSLNMNLVNVAFLL